VAKTLDDTVLDGALNIIDNADIMTVCTTQPTTRTEAVTTYKLADVAMTPGTDFTDSNGDTSGRKVRVAAKSAVPIDTTGTALFVALCDATTLLAVTTCTSQALTSGGTVDIPAWDIELADPT
jgi:acyl-CoA thioesterase